MKDIVKTVQSHHTSYVDSATGEVIEESSKKVQVVLNPSEFCLVFTKFWNSLLENPLSKADVELCAYLMVNYSDGTSFTISNYIKNEVAKKTNRSPTSYNKCTAALLASEFIIPMASRVYKINPRLAFKGSTTSRKQAILELSTDELSSSKSINDFEKAANI